MFLSLLVYYYYYSLPTDISFCGDLDKTWFFRITYIDYYLINYVNEVTDLNTIKESYFILNAFEFYVVNFSLFFGIIASILLCFSIHKIFNFLNYSQIINVNSLNSVDNGFFIRNKSTLTQENVFPGVTVWSKNKK